MFKTKETVFIFALFLLFFPVYALFNNALLFLFDHAFTQGEVSKIFNYNYTGSLLGCLGVTKYNELAVSFNFFQKNGVLLISFLISVLSCYLLFKTKAAPKYSYKWILIFLFSFFLFFSLEYLLSIIRSFEHLDSAFLKRSYLYLFVTIITVILAFFIAFKLLNQKEKRQIVFIVVPASFISAVIWLAYIGPKILPL
ncbi:hypothetical protein [Psychroserpens sp. SPM9]|uniref:hypothetical protein n=1 Tax=Psychroserpens sp. SPM9 TaxID=2975598 RepID=UPI0021A61973|nr:hypothetical protein [Psychroserpens sp. SPM9]MDG5491017.1 hypothetical protein [Psychroserpens sp. SPM9]